MIRVGGSTEIEVKERKDRVDDALNATRAAVQEGIVVPGGGVALVHAGKALLEGMEGENADQNAGIGIVRRAIQAPLRQIAENAGVDGAVVAGKVFRNRRRRTLASMPRPKSMATCCRLASSIRPRSFVPLWKTLHRLLVCLITTEAMVADKPEPKGAGGMPGGGMPDMGGMGGMM